MLLKPTTREIAYCTLHYEETVLLILCKNYWMQVPIYIRKTRKIKPRLHSLKLIYGKTNRRNLFNVTSPLFSIESAVSTTDFDVAAQLIRQYVGELGIDLSFQDFNSELTHLSAQYGHPHGALLLARDTLGQPAGCVGIRRWENDIAELKRMYVPSDFRGTGIGSALLEHAIRSARNLGYRLLRLDTLASMKSAQKLYLAQGFYEIPPYRYNPVPDTQYFELNLVEF